ncbi:hypothetical protein HHX47_DHR2000763, partial [Lentinula edodes]
SYSSFGLSIDSLTPILLSRFNFSSDFVNPLPIHISAHRSESYICHRILCRVNVPFSKSPA